jgi:multidrug efflux pump subunit AcrA (membrane-fusion protein)
MSIGSSKRTVGIGLGGAVLLAAGAWIAGDQVRSPAQIAAETAAPRPSAITAPVEKRVLQSEVIVRGTVRYGSPQPVVLATSVAKTNAGSDEIVTLRPRRGARVGEGRSIMSVSGRPVFVLRGAQASHRDIVAGSRGPDVRQLESALARMGFFPGPVDGLYDGATAAAVATWYEGNGWSPFGATDFQLEQLRVAEANAAAARDAHLQARMAVDTAAQGNVLPGDIAQARIDLETARDAADTAVSAMRTAEIKVGSTRNLSRQNTAVTLAQMNERRDNALADADVALKQAALNKALDAQVQAQRTLAEAPPDTAPAELAALQAALRAATDDVVVAQADVNAALAAANASRAAGRDAVETARTANRTAEHDARTAVAELARARRAVPTARRQVVLAARRLKVLETPGDTNVQRLLVDSTAKEARGTAAEVARLGSKMGVSVPANEVLFFPTLPLRVDTVKIKRGDSAAGTQVMTVSNSRLAIDSSLSLDDARLVRAGASVKIEEPDLGVRTTGAVTQVADRPGTNKVDPSRVYLEVSPSSAPAQVVGASVKLTIGVKSTQEAVLSVPVTALSVGADGSSRVQVQRAGGQTDYVTVQPGLAAQGLVEVRPLRGKLAVDDLVIVGSRGKSGSGTSATASTGGNTP